MTSTEWNDEKMETVSIPQKRFKSVFGGIATNILSLTSTVQQHCDEEGHESINQVRRNAYCLLRNVNTISLSNEISHAYIPQEEINITAAVTSLVKATQALFDIDISGRVPDKDLWVKADEDTLHFALLCGIRNALQYSETEKKLNISLEDDAHWAIITISDTGVGVQDVDYPFVYEPFYTQKNDKECSSLGLGLPILYRCLQHIGGDTTITTAPGGKGSKLTITMPLVKPSDPKKKNRLSANKMVNEKYSLACILLGDLMETVP